MEHEEKRQSYNSEYSRNDTHLTYVNVNKADTNDYASTGVEMCHNNYCDTNCEKGQSYFLTIFLITHHTYFRRENSSVKDFF